MEATRRHELQMITAVDLTLTYSEVEQGVIEAETRGRAPTALAPWVVEAAERAMPLEGRSGIAFLGSYGHPPNRDAVDFFLADVWPLLRQQHPEQRFHLYGSGLTEELRQNWGSIPGVVVEGWVADTASVFDQHRVCIAPLRSGAGLKGKVVGALARGMPQVLSPMAAEATGLRDGQEFLLADRPEDWLRQLGRLLDDDALWQTMSAAALTHARTHFSLERGLARMAAALRQLDLPVREVVA
ncbi:MAG: glycosyltransferase family 4 protein [Cyanobium sp.]